MKNNQGMVKLRYALGTVIVLAFLFFVFQAVAPFGSLKGEYRPTGFRLFGGQGLVGPLGPNDRVSWSDGILRLVKSPAYFSVYSPREFKQARVTFVYRNLDTANQPIMETGVLVDKNLWRFDMAGVENIILEKLMRTWERQEKDGDIILSNPNSDLKLKSSWPQIASYQIQDDLDYWQKMIPKDIGGSYLWPKLRGDQQILVGVNNRPLQFEFSFSDLNKNNQASGDPISILVYNSKNELIASHDLADSGDDMASEVVLDRGSWQIYLADLPQGFYRVEIKANDDIITAIKTANANVVLKDKVWLFEPAVLYTSSSVVRAKTPSPASLGTLVFADRQLELAETDNLYKATTSISGIKKINLSHGDIFIETEGEVAFSPATFFISGSQPLSADTNLNEVSQVVARYDAPEDLGANWRQKTVTIDLNGVAREQGYYKFIWSLPDVTKGVEIKSIKVELSGQYLFGKIKKLLGL